MMRKTFGTSSKLNCSMLTMKSLLVVLSLFFLAVRTTLADGFPEKPPLSVPFVGPVNHMFQLGVTGDATLSLKLPKEVFSANAMLVEDGYVGPKLIVDESTGYVKVPVSFVTELMEHFRLQKKLHKKYVVQILLAATKHFKDVPTLMHLSLPTASDTSAAMTVCGDTHGQYYDLLNIFEINGVPSDSNHYLFNGDFVDRGSFSFETVMVLLCWKLALPNAMFLQRGNHETRSMNNDYGFTGEVKFKYDAEVMNMFTELFNWLPLASVIEDKVFVVHGGLTTHQTASLDQIAALTRGREPPRGTELFSDLLWADPQRQAGRKRSGRGIAYTFGPEYTQAFLEKNNLQLIIRSHEVKMAGYEVQHDGKLITLFSAPNYCDEMGNKGAFIRFTSPKMEPEVTQFTAVPHPKIPVMAYGRSK